MLPNFWQLKNKELCTAITIHRINTKIDDGEVIKRFFYPLVQSESLHNTMIRAKYFSANLLYRYLCGKSFKKNKVNSSYYKFPSRKDRIEFKLKSNKLL